MRSGLLAYLLPLLSAPARGADALIVVSEPLRGAYREAFEGLREEFPEPFDVAPAGRPLPAGRYGVIIALGGGAAAAARRSGAPLIVALAPGHRGATVLVALTPSPERFVSLLASRGVSRLLAVRAAPAENEFSRRASSAAIDAGLKITDAYVASHRRLPALLRRDGLEADAIWLAPDPDAVTPGNLSSISEFARARGVLFFAPAAGLVSKDSLGDLTVSFRDCGREAGRAARELLAGRAVPKVVYPGEARR